MIVITVIIVIVITVIVMPTSEAVTHKTTLGLRLVNITPRSSASSPVKSPLVDRSWVAVKKLQLSHHNGCAHIYI